MPTSVAWLAVVVLLAGCNDSKRTAGVDAGSTGVSFGDSCADNADCASGLCVVQDRSFCSRTCGSDCDCPAGYRCFPAGGLMVCGPGDRSCGSTSPPPTETCVGVGVDCTYRSDCCDDNWCVRFDTGTWCVAECTSHSQCTTGCCNSLESGAASVCSPAPYCCGGQGDPCDSPGGCCSGHTCIRTSTADVFCGRNCTYDSDCESRCCLDLEGGGRACFPSTECGRAPGECLHDNCRALSGGYICQDGECVCADRCRTIGSSVCCGDSFCAGDCLGSPCC